MRNALALRSQTELGITVDFSAGWAPLRRGDRNIDDVLRRATTALYEAKHAGRGRLVAEPGLAPAA
jgi:PleD family two-component response regulator